jgi:hypothetical protein
MALDWLREGIRYTIHPKRNFATNMPAPAFSDREWDKLLNIILEGRVVPVLGAELLEAEVEGRTENLLQTWGRVLAEQASLPEAANGHAPALYEVTNQLSQTLNGNDLAYEIDDVVRRRTWPIPAALRHLAEITSFPLYVTTTFDHLLKAALDEVRPAGAGGSRQIFFTPRGVKNRIDLPDGFVPSESGTVFHLFGGSSTVDGSFAKTEDDLIEFSWSLLDPQYAPEKLYDFLQSRTVLLLGCNFPDWLGRFFIHALNTSRPASALSMYYVSGVPEPGLEGFLRRKRAKVIRLDSIAAFIAELHDRWNARKPAAAAAAPPLEAPAEAAAGFKRGAVFLSYASEDRAAVSRIRAQLEGAQIDTWMDTSALEPGDAFQRVIHENIRNSSFFIAIISTSLNSPGKPGRFIWREWKWAEDVSLERRRDDRFLQALVVDETAPGAPFVEAPFRDLHWARLENGLLTPEFLQILSQGIRRFRRAE